MVSKNLETLQYNFLFQSCLLPVPLSYLAELLPLVSPFEVFLLLLTVWRYMKASFCLVKLVMACQGLVGHKVM